MPVISIANTRQLLKDFGRSVNIGAAGIVKFGTENLYTGSFYVASYAKWRGLNGAFQTLAAKRDSYAANQMMFSLSINTSGTINLDCTGANFVPWAIAPPKDKWFWWGWFHDIVNNTENLYLNGRLASTKTGVTLGTDTAALNSWGACEAGAADPLNGNLDEGVVVPWDPTTQLESTLALSVWRNHNHVAPRVYHKFDEASGTSVADSSGNGHTGTLNADGFDADVIMKTRPAVPDRFFLPTTAEKSLDLTAASSYATSNIVPSTTSFSLGFWYKPGNPASDRWIVNWESTYDRNGFSLMSLGSTRQLRFIGSNALTPLNITTSTETLKAGIWIPIVLTYSSPNANIYKLSTAIAPQGVGAITSNANNLRLGARAFGSDGGTANGLIKDFTFQNGAVWTEQQMKDMFYRRKTPTGAQKFSFNNTNLDQNGLNGFTLTNATYNDSAPFTPRPSAI